MAVFLGVPKLVLATPPPVPPHAVGHGVTRQAVTVVRPALRGLRYEGNRQETIRNGHILRQQSLQGHVVIPIDLRGAPLRLADRYRALPCPTP